MGGDCPDISEQDIHKMITCQDRLLYGLDGLNKAKANIQDAMAQFSIDLKFQNS